MVGGKENVSKTTTADGGRNALLRRRLMLRTTGSTAVHGCAAAVQSYLAKRHRFPDLVTAVSNDDQIHYANQ